MGAANSTPHPLIAVNTAGGPVLVPSGTYQRPRKMPYAEGPVYTPFSHARVHPHPHTHRARPPRLPYGAHPQFDMLDDGGEGSESAWGDMMEGPGPHGGMRGYAARGMGRRGGAYVDGMVRSRSAPEIPMDMHTRPGMFGMNTEPGMHGMGPGPQRVVPDMGGGGMMDPGMSGGLPPEYTSNPQFGGLPAPGMNMNPNPYATYPGAPPSSPSAFIPAEPVSPRQAPGRSAGTYAHVPLGAYTTSEKPRRPSRTKTEPQVSAQINRGQPAGQRVGPSGEEWITGDSFLDACQCTTNCQCRKSQRVLYRARKDRGKRGSDGSDSERESGEIRYILKDDLGRNCGDHSGCRKSGSESEKAEKKKKREKKKKEEKERKAHLDGLKKELLEALDGRFRDLKVESLQQGKPESPPPLAQGPPFGMGPGAFMMGKDNLDPNMAQRMGMMGANPYATGMDPSDIRKMPPGILNPLDVRHMHGPSLPMGGLNAYDEAMSMAGMDGPGRMGRENPYMPPGTRTRRPTRPDFLSPHRADSFERFNTRGAAIDLDPYGPAMRDRERFHPEDRAQRHRPAYDSDGWAAGPSRRTGKQKAAAAAAADDDDIRDSHRYRDTEGRRAADKDFDRRRATISPPVNRRNSGPTRGRQPRADTDDDDVL